MWTAETGKNFASTEFEVFFRIGWVIGCAVVARISRSLIFQLRTRFRKVRASTGGVPYVRIINEDEAPMEDQREGLIAKGDCPH